MFGSTKFCLIYYFVTTVFMVFCSSVDCPNVGLERASKALRYLFYKKYSEVVAVEEYIPCILPLGKTVVLKCGHYLFPGLS